MIYTHTHLSCDYLMHAFLSGLFTVKKKKKKATALPQTQLATFMLQPFCDPEITGPGYLLLALEILLVLGFYAPVANCYKPVPFSEAVR